MSKILIFGIILISIITLALIYTNEPFVFLTSNSKSLGVIPIVSKNYRNLKLEINKSLNSRTYVNTSSNISNNLLANLESSKIATQSRLSF